MSRRDDLSPDDRRIWARVAGSVTPRKPKKAALITPGAAVVDPPAAPLPRGLAKPRPAAPACMKGGGCGQDGQMGIGAIR